MPQTKEQLRRLREKYHLGEYSHKARGRARRPRPHHAHSVVHRRGSGFMARRRGFHRRRSGLGGLGKPLLAMGGLISMAALGYAASTLAKQYNVQPIGSWTGPAAGFAVGGPVGAVAGYFAQGGAGSSNDSTNF